MSAESSAASANPATQSQAADFGRAAMAILVAMVLLIVALTGILVETTLRSPTGQIEVLPPTADPGSFARR
jgi:hydrogenase-4 membrane subunit HyfE